MEKIRFVWEVVKNVSTYVARKERRYEDMKKLYEEIENTIQELKEVRDISEKAEEFGVLKVSTGYYGYSVGFKNGELWFNVKLIGERTGEDPEQVRERINKDWKEALNWLIAFEEEQLKRMKGFLKEAEKYLVVEVIDDEDEESEEY